MIAIVLLLFTLFHFSSSFSSKFELRDKSLEGLYMIKYGGLHHAGILVRDAEKSKKFFIDVLCFEDESHLRPTSLPYPGAFLRCGSNQIHLMQLPSMDPVEGRPEHGGRDRHVAITISNIDMLRDRLNNVDIPFTLSHSGRRALFCRDIDGNAFEFMEDSSLI
eukprot:gene586-1134_t